MTNNEVKTALIYEAIKAGAFKANVIEVKDIQFDVRFRDTCASNLCGNYGRCWTCPPDCGEINEMIKSLSKFKYALVYQTVGTLEDSFDVENMEEVAKEHHKRTLTIRKAAEQILKCEFLNLGAGGCRICDICAKKTNEPCRNPNLATVSLEAYGINVSTLAKTAEMKYINGQNTVTYFSAVLFNEEHNE